MAPIKTQNLSLILSLSLYNFFSLSHLTSPTSFINFSLSFPLSHFHITLSGKIQERRENHLMRAQKRSIHAVSTWVRRQPPKVKAFLAVIAGMTALVLLRFIVHDHDNLFVAAEAVHSIGISVLIYKLMKEKTCAGKVFQEQILR